MIVFYQKIRLVSRGHKCANLLYSGENRSNPNLPLVGYLGTTSPESSSQPQTQTAQ
jgi:hypothetical protein